MALQQSMKLLIIDNYDSFTYNLVHIIESLGYSMDVFRNDKIAIEAVERYDKILLSPGPGIPSEAGIMMDLIKKYAPVKSMLGVCLGHQGIAETFGAQLKNLKEVLHGKSLETQIVADDFMFQNVAKSFPAGHYHSWVIDPATVPDCLEVTAIDELSHIMAIRHLSYDLRGVQFHPESVMTDCGQQIIKNWLEH